jgi:carbamoyltransferase
MNNKKPLWIAGIARGHNAGVCLLKDGEIVFSIEEERLTRRKYDGGPLASMLKILEYTDKVDYLAISHTTTLDTAGKLDYSGEDPYSGLARKLGLIESLYPDSPEWKHPQVIDMAMFHHKMHAGLAFYRSGFSEAVALIVDGAGTFFPISTSDESMTIWETESIYKCSYPAEIKTLHKTMGTRNMMVAAYIKDFDAGEWEPNATFNVSIGERAGIVKAYEAVTEYCGWTSIEAGKTMGLFPYGKPNDSFPDIMDKTDLPVPITNRNLIVPRYPMGAVVNCNVYNTLNDHNSHDVTLLQNRRDMAYAVQTETQQAVVDLIKHSVELSGCKNVVISGGYGLNCVANYYYLEALKDEGINIYVEPVSNDAGTAMGAALLYHHTVTKDATVRPREDNVYLGPIHNYSVDDINNVAEKYNAVVSDATHEDIVELMTSKNIVANFQGRSENGPRALGNRSLMFDPRFKDGKDFVNEIKHREYFRPFAGSILEEDVHEWFDLRGMESSPTMMYAVNCQPGIEEKIPAIIHVDGTCRIQTVSREQNPHYYDIIKAFKEKTGCPIIFNTSFNLGGEPLVETLDDAIRTLENCKIEYLYLPEHGKLITVKN